MYGVTAWRAPEIVLSDGICRRCVRRLREDLRFPPHAVDSVPDQPAWESLVPGASVALAVIATVLLVSQPLDVPPPAPVLTDGLARPVAGASANRGARIQPLGMSRAASHRTVTARFRHVDSALPRAVALPARWRGNVGPPAEFRAPAGSGQADKTSAPGVLTFNDRAAPSGGLGVQAP